MTDRVLVTATVTDAETGRSHYECSCGARGVPVKLTAEANAAALYHIRVNHPTGTVRGIYEQE